MSAETFSDRDASDAWPGMIERSPVQSGSWPEGLCLVLVHGLMDRGAGLAHLTRQFRDAHTIRYDRRGYERARGLPTGGLVNQVDDLISIVGDRPVMLFGHSFGGLVALSAATTGRLDLRGIVTWEVPAPWLGSWPAWNLPEKIDDDPTLAETFMRMTIGDEAWDALPERTRSTRRAEGGALRSDMDPRLEHGIPFDTDLIDVPVVLGVGDRPDTPYPRAAVHLAEQLPRASIHHLAGATHRAPLERAGDLAALIRLGVAEADRSPGDAEDRDAALV